MAKEEERQKALAAPVSSGRSARATFKGAWARVKAVVATSEGRRAAMQHVVGMW